MRTVSVALFVGADITSQVLGLKLSRSLVCTGIEVLFIECIDQTPGDALVGELRQIKYLEEKVLQEFVYPWLETTQRPIAAPLECPQSFSLIEKHFHPIEVPNINSESLVELLHARNAKVGVTIGCPQKAGEPLLSFFNEKNNGCSPLLNLHSGMLPAYRGVMTFIQAMSNRESTVGYSLHEVSSIWCGGPIVGTIETPVIFGQSALWHMNRCSQHALKLTLAAICAELNGEPIKVTPQVEAHAKYYSFPTEAEFARYRKRGITYVEYLDIRDIVVQNFSAPNTAHELRLQRLLAEAMCLTEAEPENWLTTGL